MITFASAATADVILLSQKEKSGGKFEGDAEVDFVEDDAGVTFTLTAVLAQALSGYRCGVHTLTMRGAVSD